MKPIAGVVLFVVGVLTGQLMSAQQPRETPSSPALERQRRVMAHL